MACVRWHCYVIELHAYDFVIKDFVIKRDVICAGCCIFTFSAKFTLNWLWFKWEKDTQLIKHISIPICYA